MANTLTFCSNICKTNPIAILSKALISNIRMEITLNQRKLKFEQLYNNKLPTEKKFNGTKAQLWINKVFEISTYYYIYPTYFPF